MTTRAPIPKAQKVMAAVFVTIGLVRVVTDPRPSTGLFLCGALLWAWYDLSFRRPSVHMRLGDIYKGYRSNRWPADRVGRMVNITAFVCLVGSFILEFQGR
ncbi:MAG: hypothetical protein AAGC76_02025 [Luteibacter sp.]|uniref:hypothetical protein n=1 Tax=Luteibacter sp. TaxID=1886636 RepID=UPI002809755A|nr:hypothetical protein [Luteibacter sp.]MDQ7994611.1 hypothetical protein [Luteibacter sp.]